MTAAGWRIGLMGGSFNPAHGGHRAVALAVMRALALDEVWWLVSPGNPLKTARGMAPLATRFASAQAMARLSRIRPTVIESALGTRYTADTLRRIDRRYPQRRFIWIMGSDNLAQFHRWQRWRDIARTMPIAIVHRPGYIAMVKGTSAVTWLRRYVRPVDQRKKWTQWRLPALVHLRFRPDPRSATAIRRAHPHWFEQPSPRHLRDPITHRAVPEKE